LTIKIFLSIFLYFNLQLLSSNSFAQAYGFVDEVFFDNLIISAGLTFDAYGKMYVWEKS
jgi:hypothetical protein